MAEAKSISYYEMAEIAEATLSYLADNDLLDDFLEDRDIELDETKMEYFFPEGDN